VIILTVIHMVQPAQDSTRDRGEVPLEMCDLWLAPSEIDIVVNAN
jgi:hypothetical protein